MKYLKVFETDVDQQNYINGEFDRPNITIVRHKKQTINYVSNIIDGEDDADKIVNHGVITFEGDTYYLTFQFPIACEYMTVDCIPQYWELRKGSSRTASHAAHFEGLGDTIEIYASNNGYDDYNATNEDDTYIYEVVIEQESLITFTVDGTEYQAEEGMTWGDWCDSEYNTSGFIHAAADQGFAIYTADRKKAFNHGIAYGSLVISGNYLLSKVDWPIPK